MLNEVKYRTYFDSRNVVCNQFGHLMKGEPSSHAMYRETLIGCYAYCVRRAKYAKQTKIFVE